MDDLQQFVPNVHFEQIPIKNLVSNQEYQRNISAAHVKRAALDFNLYQINPVKVSRRDGVNYVFNGQHTVEIVAAVSNSRDTPVWCMVYDDMEYMQEADIFANQLKYVKTLSPYEIFTANLEAGNDTQLLIKSLVESYGLFVASNKAVGGICAIATLESIYHKHGYHVLDRVLRICLGTWEGDDDSFSANIMNGVMRLVVAFEDELKDDTFKERIGRISIRDISRASKERQAGSLGYAETMLNIYNKKTRNNPLLWEKLQSVKSRRAQQWENTNLYDKDTTEEA